jgi:hypothetical protein
MRETQLVFSVGRNIPYSEFSLFVLKKLGGLMSLADYSHQCAAFSINSCTKLMADKRV